MITELHALIWIIVGFILVVAEFFIPSLIVVFFGTSAIATGIALWLGMPASHGIPFFVFAVLTLGQIYFLRGIFREWFHGGMLKRPGSQDDDNEFTDKEAEVASGFEDGAFRGRVRFRGTEWDARSEEPLQRGDRVVIENREGSTLHVTKKTNPYPS